MPSLSDLRSYRFLSVWKVPAPREHAFAALRDLERYPLWWPEVKTVRRLDEETCELVCRSSLPYNLRFVTRQKELDEQAGILEATMSGDLEGFSRWTISGGSGLSLLTFEEEVRTNMPLLDRLALVGRPFFKVNHSLMMRRGERGLQTFLAGMDFAAERREGRGN